MGSFVHIQQFEKPLYDLEEHYTNLLRPQGFKLLSNGESFLQFGSKVTIKNGVSVMFLANHFACPDIANTFNPQNLDGEFAMVLMNRTNRQTNLSRDVFGAKSLFYYFHNKLLIAATELKFILSVLEEKVEVNKSKIHEYLDPETDGEVITPDTFFSKIKRVLPGETVIVFPEGLKNQFHYNPKDQPIEHYPNPINFFGNSFEASIKRRTSSKQTGSFLSGGLDSSSIVSQFRNLSDQELNTYYFDTQLASAKEKVLALEVAELKNTKHLNLTQQPELIRECIQNIKITASPDTSSIPSTIFSSIFRAAHENGDQVILSGHGGDNILEEGWSYLNQLYKSGDKVELERALELYFGSKGLSEKEINYELEKFLLKRSGNQSFMTMLKNLPSISTVSELVYQRWTREKPEKWHATKAIILPKKKAKVKDFYSKVEDENTLRLLGNNLSTLSIQAMETIGALSSFYGISTTYPFLTKEILETSAKIPAKLNFNEGIGRGILRNSMDGILPEAVRIRKDKASFNDFLLEYVQKISSFKIPENHQVWNYAVKSTYYKAHKLINSTSQEDQSMVVPAKIVYRIISLALWLDTFYS